MRLSELYTSVQGEGPGAGHMTQFIRFGGCNLRCPGWPCDTQHAIDPKLYRQEWEKVTPEEIVDRVLPYPHRVTLTGGEPFLQPLGEMDNLIALLIEHEYSIEVFTNGTLKWSSYMTQHKVYYPQSKPSITVIMDWKLQGSGEDPHDPQRIEHLRHLGPHDAVKFVIKDENDFKQAVHLWETWIHGRSGVQVYYGAVWGAVKDSTLVQWVQEEHLDWKLNVQMHNYIFDRNERGI